MSLNKLLFYPLFLLFFVNSLYSQLPEKWYFGQNAAIDFSSGNLPIPFGGSLMNTPAGCAVSSDGTYYSNGQTIWTVGGVLPNGQGLNGSMQSTQSVGIIKITKADSLIVFTTDAAAGNMGLNYHIISRPVNKQGYKVVSKNNLLLPRVTEKLAIGLHCNKLDYWVLTHGWNDNKFYAYHIDTVKLDTIPIITSIGTVHGGQTINAAGYLKFNAQVDKVAAAITGAGIIELFKFDNINGTLSSPITISNINNAYGVEFDRTGLVLYVSTLSGILYQFDLSFWNQTDILNSKFLLTADVSLFGALQRGPDNRIYLARDNSNYLAGINFPTTLGTSANYIPNLVYLNGAKSEAGLPQIFQITQFFETKGSKACLGDNAFFKIYGDTTRIDSVLWNFGDTMSQTDTSTLFSPNYLYPKRGTYKFQLIIYHCSQADTLENFVEILGPPYANLGLDISICSNDNFELFGGYATSYLWQNGDTTPTFLVLDTGLYWVRLINHCGEDSDTVRIKNVFQSPKFSLPNDTVLCVTDSMMFLSPFGQDYFSLWNDSINSDSMKVTQPGLYSLLIIDSNFCKFRDDILIGFEPFPMPNLGNDTVICYGKNIQFNGQFPGNYLWNDGSEKADLVTHTAGIYILFVSNACGINSDTVNLEIAPCEQVVWVPNAFTPNDDGKNDLFLPYVENVMLYHLMIFDRWGNLLFETNDPNLGWDGRVNSELLPNDAYIWKMVFKDFYNFQYSKSGFVVLLK